MGVGRTFDRALSSRGAALRAYAIRSPTTFSKRGRGVAFAARTRTVDWAISDSLVDYDAALAAMAARAEAVRTGAAPELVWLLEHPPIYTAGTSAKAADLLDGDSLPVRATGRGGQFTYHGPGQRIAYVILDLNSRGRDVRGLIENLEAWIITALAAFNVVGESRPGRIGIWVRRPTLDGEREDKIAALGLRVARGITTHGVSLNVEPDLSHYAGIVPCGVTGHGVTSLADLGLPVGMADADVALRRAFEGLFGKVAPAKPPL
jgi:lipoyl(octanoyl) transferase